MAKAQGTFEISSMDEATYEEREGDQKLTRAGGDQTFSGGITGQGAVTWLMSYQPDGSARYVGLQRITGSIGEREGSFVIAADGRFDGAASSGTWEIIEGSGTGDLEGIRGSGRFHAPGGKTASYDLDYELD